MYIVDLAEGGSGEEDQKGKEEKEKKIKEIEKTVDSHFKKHSEKEDHKS